VRGFKDDPNLVERICAEAPTSRRIDSLREVRQDEWDVLVTDSRVSETVHDPFGITKDIYLAQHIGVLYQPSSSGLGYVEDRPDWRSPVEHFPVQSRRSGADPQAFQNRSLNSFANSWSTFLSHAQITFTFARVSQRRV
jgi:hypothetical protein